MSQEVEFIVKCPSCGAEWMLDKEERQKAEFTCRACWAAFDVKGARLAEGVSNPARLSDIVSVVIRLMAVSAGYQGSTYLLYALSLGVERSQGVTMEITYFAIYAVCTAVLWFLAPPIARWVSRGNDLSVEIGAISVTDLYTFAFFLVGIYWAVESIGPALTTLFYYFRENSDVTVFGSPNPMNGSYIFRDLLRLILGLGLLFKGRRIATWLVRRQEGESAG